ncbi:M56 family metallopeptidase [Mucilaginibacter lutimaris]|uniref:M56 family metallopeptidase n=1 Tax=Mucilaginibacter lutimaris TaxID=931629 RepID=A0ABW2ZIX9_9SPHI
MENILYNISQVLGITIIHSLWQGLLIYFLLRVVLLLATGLSSSKKYLFAVSSLLAITGWFAYTLIAEIQLYDWLAKPADLKNMPLLASFPHSIQQFGNQSIRYYYSIERYLPYVTGVYALGLVLNMVRVVLAHRKIRVIKRTMSLGVQLQQQITAFAKKMDITRTVKVGFSQFVDVPCIVGYFKPVILLPFTLSTYLGSEEIEAILMHELAHIKRNDYLINLLQQVVTTLLFFNPCVLLINKIIGEERENSCDDMVVDATQNPVVYAKALFKLEQNRQNELQLALAVTGKKYYLLNRIERIMKTKKQIPSVRPTLVAMLILTLSVGSLALLNPQIAQGKISVKKITPEAIKAILTDTIPAKKAVKYQAKATKAMAQKAKAEAKWSAKAVAEKNNGHVYYNYNGLNDPELGRLSKEVSKHGDAIGKYYESAAFKAQSEQMDKLGKDIDAFYNSDKIKQATAAQEKAAAKFERQWGSRSGKIDELSKQMSAAGEVMSKYYESKDFKDMNARIAKKYGVPVNGTFTYDERDHNENYRKYQDELKKNIPADVLQQQDKMKELGKQMRSYTNDPEVQKVREEMRAAGDRMREAFNNPDIKLKQEEMRKTGREMRAFTRNPEIEKEKKALREASEKLRAYTKTPEFKKKVAEYRKAHPEQYYNWNNNNDEKPEAAEKPEAPEKPEPAESN